MVSIKTYTRCIFGRNACQDGPDTHLSALIFEFFKNHFAPSSACKFLTKKKIISAL